MQIKGTKNDKNIYLRKKFKKINPHVLLAHLKQTISNIVINTTNKINEIKNHQKKELFSIMNEIEEKYENNIYKINFYDCRILFETSFFKLQDSFIDKPNKNFLIRDEVVLIMFIVPELELSLKCIVYYLKNSHIIILENEKQKHIDICKEYILHIKYKGKL